MDNEGSSRTRPPESALDLAGLTRRVARLEKENRWLRRVAPALLPVALLSLLASGGQPKRIPDRIDTHELALVDRSGKDRLTISFFPPFERTPDVAFVEGIQSVAAFSCQAISFPKGGVDRAFIGIDADSLTGIRLRDTEAKHGVLLGTDDTGMPYVMLDRNDRDRLELLGDKRGIRLELTLDPRRRSAPWLGLFNPKARSRLLMTPEDDGDEPMTHQWSSAGSVMSVGIAHDGSIGWKIFDDKSRPRMDVRVSKAGDASLQLVDDAGTVVSKLP
jgi:hypothetical protein